MKRNICAFTFVALAAAFFGAGCTVNTPAKPKKTTEAAESKKPATTESTEIQTNLAKLNPEDRKAAEAQKWCAVDDENPLGDMGVPFKVMVKGQPVFLCCKGCQKTALANPEKTIAKVAELKIKAASETK